jgi:murein DD-endopeptidase MepM/ murein hydrolase activator NlpD
VKLTTLVVCLFVSLFACAKAAYSADRIDSAAQNFGTIVLEERSNISITAWLGSTSCREGQILLASPTEAKVISRNFVLEKENVVSDHLNELLISDYGKGRQKVLLGPYPKGTKLEIVLRPGSFCGGSYSSTDRFRSRFRHNGGNSWTIAWEDFKDFDLNDVYTEVAILPLQNQIVEEVTVKQAFSNNPTYKLPWPKGVGHKLTSYPGYPGEHRSIDAYDFAMRSGDLIVASEQGVVMWIEDSFGSGGCDQALRGKTNVLVIWTEEGVNQTYLHLKQGSVTEFGLKIGDQVSQGQPIARAGNSGYSCSSGGGDGTHLHIEWQYHCYELENVAKRKPKPTTATLAWSCPSFATDAPYQFTIGEKTEKLSNLNKIYISDN